jgi:hypothetical protein
VCTNFYDNDTLSGLTQVLSVYILEVRVYPRTLQRKSRTFVHSSLSRLTDGQYKPLSSYRNVGVPPGRSSYPAHLSRRSFESNW